ncbi:MAG: ATP-binding protein [Succinivibrionaceae bacterium]|jgi:predicted AAA+ superfamily ATPase|nr:ATP-binding protein [Succinivibrionaceae bacterium]
MLKRKIERDLLEWKKTPGHMPVLIKGIRQCGKTFIARKFASEHYRHVVYVNFIQDKGKSEAFTGSKNIDRITLYLSAVIPGAVFEPGQTCIILDEIQECPDARTSLKFFREDGRYDVIATGSLLGVMGYGSSRRKEQNPSLGRNSVPVGSETIMAMYTLDFEEFLWANGIGEEVIAAVKQCFLAEKPVPGALHDVFRQLFFRYVAIGGLPAAVNAYLEKNNIGYVAKVCGSVLGEYKDDMVKYAPDDAKPRILECFSSIPAQLAKENKKFQYSVVRKNARASQYEGSLQWLEDAGIICRCYNVFCPELPLAGNRKNDVFKIYAADIGLLVQMLDAGVRADILHGRLLMYKGAIFESVMADFLHKKGQSLYYYQKDSGLELDFLIRQDGECVACEVKATGSKAKSLNTVIAHPETYHIHRALKFGDYNVGRSGDVLTLPAYMAMFLEFDRADDMILPPVDVEAANKAACSMSINFSSES